MNREDWRGVIPAITTPFTVDGSVDHALLGRHAAWMVEQGCRGVVALGSLGEGGCLDSQERMQVLGTLVAAVGTRVPVIAGIAALSTRQAAGFARDAQRAGCSGLMVLPPYVYGGRWEELRAHMSEVIGATDLSCMLYNNPIAYGTDVLPEQVAELAAGHANLHAVKESSADVRRVTAIRSLLGDRLAVFVGVDDVLVEGVAAGAVGWIAGLVNALPKESVKLFDLARAGRWDEAFGLYRWFLPLLRMDTTYDFVQLIKLVQAEVGMAGLGGAAVRPPRMLPEGAELERVLGAIRACLKSQPKV